MSGDKLNAGSLGGVAGDVKRGKNQSAESATPLAKTMESFYVTNSDSILQNWYTQKPYAFVFTDQKGDKNTFYLPIAPSNISINTHWATNIITTMYGTVEEHSEQRYYDITIAGTTAMMPRYHSVIEGENGTNDKFIGRAGFAVRASLGRAASGFFKRTLSILESSINQATEVFGGKDKPSSGVDLKKTGYVAFHNLYKFLLAYKKDTASSGIRQGSGTTHPLKFINYKDNNEYDVAVQGFQLTRDVNDPFLYNYNITLRAYNLRTAGGQVTAFDVNARNKELGLDGIKTSLLSKMSNKAAQAKRAAYGVVGAAKGFGK